jgi:hypothetical protein
MPPLLRLYLFDLRVYGKVFRHQNVYGEHQSIADRYRSVVGIFANQTLRGAITPREPDHPYAFVHWRIWFWTLSIYVPHLDFYRDRLRGEVGRYGASYRGGAASSCCATC